MTRSIEPTTVEPGDALRPAPEPPELWLVRLFGALVLHTILLFGVRSAWVKIAVAPPGEGGTIEFVEVGTVETDNQSNQPKAEGVAPLRSLKLGAPVKSTLEPDQAEVISQATPLPSPSPEPSPSPQPVEPAKPEPPKPKPDPPVKPKPDPPVKPKPDPPVKPKSDQPVKPKSDQPVKPKSDQPVKPKSDQPVKPKSDQPVKPKPDQPTQPKSNTEVPPKVETVPIDDNSPPARTVATTIGSNRPGEELGEYGEATDLQLSDIKPVLIADNSPWPIGQKFALKVQLVLANPSKRERFALPIAAADIVRVDVTAPSMSVEKQSLIQDWVREALTDAVATVTLDSTRPDGEEVTAVLWEVEVMMIVQPSTRS
jgi:hypothetical protein